METPYTVYDFGSSARVARPLWLAMHQWLTKYADLFVEHWSNFSPTGIQAVSSSIDAAEFEAMRQQWEGPSYGVEFSVAGANGEKHLGMMVVARPQLLTLLMDVLGNKCEDVVEDREMTSVESSLSKLVFEQALSSFAEAWSGKEPLECTLDELTDQPSRSRMLAPETEVLTGGITVCMAAARIDVQLVIEKSATQKMLGVETRPPVFNKDRRVSHESIASIPVALVATLGEAEISMSELVSLAVDDIIVLDQRVDQPVAVSANDRQVMQAWPVQVEGQQAIRVSET